MVCFFVSFFCQIFSILTKKKIFITNFLGALQDAITTKNFEFAQILFQRIMLEQLRKSVAEPPKLHALFSPNPQNEQELIKFLNLLIENKELLDVNSLDSAGWTCLHHAIHNNYSQKILRMLLEDAGN